ncbi:MAG: hypothetical protein IJB90_03405 [Clostridia bacterium]|nr:hypothetical protein [Clostridia bacterium]
MATKKSKKRKNKKSSIVTLLIVGSMLLYTLYKVISLILVPTDISIVENGMISQEESTIGYVIREEKIAKGNNYQNGIYQIKTEGEKVANGDSIFRYYSSNEESLNEKIDELNNKIQEAMLGQTNLFPADVKAIENQIENEIDGLKFKNNIQDITENKKDIDTYITKKSKIAGELSQAGSYINSLIKEREEYQSQLKINSEYVKAPISGVVSYRVDNLEEILTPSNFETLSKDTLNNLDLKTGQIIATSNEMGKVINNYECYIAIITDSKEAKEAKVGNKVLLRLSTQDEVNANITYISKQEDESVLIVFKITDSVEKLIDYRKISLDIIWWKFDGLKIPKSAIIYDNGLSYVVRNRAGYYNKILVKILKESENYCIVDNYNYDELKSIGYSEEEVYNVRKISIYDEIIVNPSLEDFNQ